MRPQSKSADANAGERPEGETGAERTICPKCGAQVSSGETFCEKCGSPVPTKSASEKEPRNLKKSLLLFARDIVFAIVLVAIVLGAVFAYTRVWPPMVVIESASMQHDDRVSHIGVIDTGDLVLVQSAPGRSDVITWVEGKATGYMTYSNYGDVIIFHKPGMETPIIHRPIFYMEYNAANNTFNIPDLARLPLNVLWGGTNSDNSQVRSPIGLDKTIWIAESGWRGDINFTFTISNFLGHPPGGYVTMGDNNAEHRATASPPRRASGGYDDYLVRQSDIVGKARGELPWFGLIKLTLYPSPGACCDGWGDTVHAPANSWDSLLYSIILIILVPILLDVLSILVGRWRRSKGKGKEEKPDVGSEATPSQPPEPVGGASNAGETAPTKGEPPPDEPKSSGDKINGPKPT